MADDDDVFQASDLAEALQELDPDLRQRLAPNGPPAFRYTGKMDQESSPSGIETQYGDDRHPGLSPSGFKLARSIRPETSLMMLVKKRAHPDYVGFVDVTSMAPVTAPQNRGLRVNNAIVNTPVDKHSVFLRGNFEEQMKYLNHRQHGPVAKQLLLIETLPQYDFELNLNNIADCLLADCPAVRRDATSRLERLITVTKCKEISAEKTHLLAVAQKTHNALHDMPDQCTEEEKNHHMRLCAHLHLLAMCALLCRHRPTADECRLFMSWPPLNKKQTGYDVRQEMLRSLHAFYENFERHLKALTKMSDKTSLVLSDRKKFGKAEFRDQAMLIFHIINKIACCEWSDEAKDLIQTLTDLYDSLARESKRVKPEVKNGLDSLLLRCLVVLLNTTYATARQDVGESQYDHPLKTAQLLATVVRSINPALLKGFLPQLSTVAFHESPEVRYIAKELMHDTVHHPTILTNLDHLQVSMGVADFHVDPPKTPEEKCKWYVLNGRFRDQKADCRVMVHAGKCPANRTSSDCLDHPRGKGDEEWQFHKRNMEMLMKLSGQGAGGEGSHVKPKGPSHLVQLMAYQVSPFRFYATETAQDRRLLQHLINHRVAQRWLSTAKLARVMHDVISGLEFLATKNIACRDITCYDMLVGGRRRRVGLGSELGDVLSLEDFTIKLCNLGHAHHFRSANSGRRAVIPVETQGDIPLLWTPPEALLESQYSDLSMVYSAGCVMFELWTHGCQPFTTYQTNTADTVRMMLLKRDSMPLVQWPCIPTEVYTIMRQCTSSQPSVRPGLAQLKLKFMDLHGRKSSSEDVQESFDIEDMEKMYPSFSDDQVRRKHVPERGIPLDVQQVIDDYKVNRNDSYRNFRHSRWQEYSGPTLASGRELNSPDWMQIAYCRDYTSVREKLTSYFVDTELAELEKMTMKEEYLHGVTTWIQDADNFARLERESKQHIVHERRYQPAWLLQDAASKGLLAMSESGYIDMVIGRYLHVLISIARSVNELHEAGWLHRDIRASSVLVDCKDGQATLGRIGRMCQVNNSKGSVEGKPFEDSWRWLAPEVLSGGGYTRANDVFMFGTLCWETFWCRHVAEHNPTCTEQHFMPFADEPKANILNLVREKKALPKGGLCPDWLHKLSVKCREADPAMRPPMSRVVLELEREHHNPPDPDRAFLTHPKLLVDALEQRASSGEEVPELPERFQTRRTAPQPDRSLTDSMGSVSYSRRRPVNEWSIILQPRDGDCGSTVSSQNTDFSGYLTPTSDDIQSVVDARFKAGGLGRCSSDSDVPESSHNSVPRLPARSASQGEFVSSSHGLNIARRDVSSMRGRVMRPGKGYPSGRQLPSLPVEPEEDETSRDSDYAHIS